MSIHRWGKGLRVITLQMEFEYKDKNYTISSFVENGRKYLVKHHENSQRINIEGMFQAHAYRMCPRSVVEPINFEDGKLRYLYYDMTLAERYIEVETSMRVTLHELLGHMANCFKTMQIIHSIGIVHAKLDLVSLYLDWTGKRVLIGDFSLSRNERELTSEDIRTLLEDNRRPSPEYLDDAASLQAFKQDVWSLGLSFVYLWCSSIEQVDYSDPHFIEEILRRENSPQPLIDILTRACAYNPNDRLDMRQLHEMTVDALITLEAQLEAAAKLLSKEVDLYKPEAEKAIELLLKSTKGLNMQITHTLCRGCQKVVKTAELVTLTRCAHRVCGKCSLAGLTEVVQHSEGLGFAIACRCGQLTLSSEIPAEQLFDELWEAALRKVIKKCPVCRSYIEQLVGMRGYFLCRCRTKLCANCLQPWRSSRHACELA